MPGPRKVCTQSLAERPIRAHEGSNCMNPSIRSMARAINHFQGHLVLKDSDWDEESRRLNPESPSTPE